MIPPLTLDRTCSEDTYLCQVNATTSCGACCGLYNLPELSHQRLSAILRRRSRDFTMIPREIGAIDDFAHKESERLPDPKPFPKFHHCPFVGLIGSRHTRVGCLLHPLAQGNHGVDYRGISYYGGMACRDYFCPATRTLAPTVRQILHHLELDWYEYGLIVTEAPLLQALFEQMRARWKVEQVSDQPVQGKIRTQYVKKLFTLKLNWPYRPDEKSLCHYLFEDGIYRRSGIDYQRLNSSPSRYDGILVELDSYFESKAALKSAEDLLTQLMTYPGA